MAFNDAYRLIQSVRRCEDTHGVITFDVNGPRGAADMGPMMCLRNGLLWSRGGGGREGGIQLYFLLSLSVSGSPVTTWSLYTALY